jgi:LacI family transcriptional regulator
MSVTLKDIALKARVSYNTVSEIVNLGREHKFADATVARVKRAAAELGYSANHFARTLKTGRKFLVGVSGLHPRLLVQGFQSPYLANVYSGIAEFFVDTPYKLVFHHYSTIDNLGELDDQVKNRIVDGLIFIIYSYKLPQFVDFHARFLRERHFPFVMVHSCGLDFGYPALGWDGVAGGRMGTAHLIDHGYPTVGLVRVQGDSHLRLNELEAGYRQALAQHGRPVNEGLIFRVDNFDAVSGYHLAERLLADRPHLPRALFITDEGIAQGMLKRFVERGVNVPGEVAVVASGNRIDERLVLSDLTCVETAGRAKGKLAAQLLHRLIEHPDEKAGQTVTILMPELVIKKSCGCK